MRPAIFALALLSICAMTLAKDRKPAPPMPDRFVIGRDTFFDFGPPFHYVELLLKAGQRVEVTVEFLLNCYD